MVEERLINQVLKMINSNYSNIYIIDIVGDIVYKLAFNENNNLKIGKSISYTDFIDLANKFIFHEDLSKYFEHISINNLEQESIKGNKETKFKYRKLCETGEYRWYLNIINYLPFEGKKLIFMISEDISERLTDSETKNSELENKIISYEQRINKENDSISNAIYEINNMFENPLINNMKNSNTKDYINSVFNKLSIDHPELNKAIISKQLLSNNYKKKTILIVDDSSIIRNSLKRIFASEFDILFAKDGLEAVKLIEENIVNPMMNENTLNIVGVLLDLMMPNKDGFYVLDYMNKFNLLNRIPVAIISGDETKETRKKVYQYDIVDMLEKPFNTENIKRRISKIINLHIAQYNLANMVNIQTEKNYEDDKIKMIIEMVVKNILNKDSSIKLQKIVKILATNLNTLDNKMIDEIVSFAPLYNIGAIAIDEKTVITTKSIQESIDYGLAIGKLLYGKNECLENIIEYSLEMYNGSGYPKNLVGDAIPIEAQIVNLAVRINESNLTKLNTTIKNIKEIEYAKYNPILIEDLNNSKKEIKDLI